MPLANIRRIFKILKTETKIEVTLHIMRHMFATQTISGSNIEMVQKMLCHANIVMTMIYEDINQRIIKEPHIRCVI